MLKLGMLMLDSLGLLYGRSSHIGPQSGIRLLVHLVQLLQMYAAVHHSIHGPSSCLVLAPAGCASWSQSYQHLKHDALQAAHAVILFVRSVLAGQ